MYKENALVQKDHVMTLQAEGETKQEALGQIFAKLKKEIYKEIDQMIVYMEPKAIDIAACQVQEYTERFLFLFMPRKKQKVSITATITVAVKYVEL